jgi:hypothetical protein
MIDFREFAVRVMEPFEVADSGEALDLRFINRNAPDLVRHGLGEREGEPGAR